MRFHAKYVSVGEFGDPVARATSSTVAPSPRRSIAITASCFDGRFASDGGSGKVSIADHS
jgi:hypothetical protein